MYYTGTKTIKKNTNSTQHKSQTQCARAYEVTLFLSTDCELSTDTCSKKFIVLAPGVIRVYTRFRRKTANRSLNAQLYNFYISIFFYLLMCIHEFVRNDIRTILLVFSILFALILFMNVLFSVVFLK